MVAIHFANGYYDAENDAIEILTTKLPIDGNLWEYVSVEPSTRLLILFRSLSDAAFGTDFFYTVAVFALYSTASVVIWRQLDKSACTSPWMQVSCQILLIPSTIYVFSPLKESLLTSIIIMLFYIIWSERLNIIWRLFFGTLIWALIFLLSPILSMLCVLILGLEKIWQSWKSGIIVLGIFAIVILFMLQFSTLPLLDTIEALQDYDRRKRIAEAMAQTAFSSTTSVNLSFDPSALVTLSPSRFILSPLFVDTWSGFISRALLNCWILHCFGIIIWMLIKTRSYVFLALLAWLSCVSIYSVFTNSIGSWLRHFAPLGGLLTLVLVGHVKSSRNGAVRQI